jgi:spore germination cell wall hydrolase CwlJ-like protein
MISALTCMAVAIYFEARSEPIAGQFAIANVIMNRVFDNRYPNDICDVVKQGKIYSKPEDKVYINQCQFSFFCDGKSDEPEDLIAFENALRISNTTIILRVSFENVWHDLTDGSTHYHSVDINPDWAKTKTKVVRIENHVFYRWEENVPDKKINYKVTEEAVHGRIFYNN